MLYYIEKAHDMVSIATRYGIPLEDEMVIASLVMHIRHIGEQLSQGKLSASIKENYPNVSWSQIKSFRNIVFHDHSRINGVEVIRILTKELSRLSDQLQFIIKDIEKYSSTL